MPPVVAAAAAAIGTAAASFSLTNFLISTAISMALNAVQGALFGKKPNRSDTSAYQGINEVIRSSIEPHRIIYGRARVGGTLIWAGTRGDKNKYLDLVIVVAGHQVSAIGDIWLDDTMLGPLDGSGNVTSGRFAGFVRVFKHLGGADQVVDPDLFAAVPGIWTEAHRLRGRSYVHLALTWDQNIFPTGIPAPKFLVDGYAVYDPRTMTTGWSDNWALCMRHYLTSPYGVLARDDELDDDLVISAANICDEDVVISGGTQKRYTMNGTFSADEGPLDILDRMNTAAAGAVVYTKGKYCIYPAAYRTPEMTLTADDFIGEFRVSPALPRSDLYNRVRGTYVNPDNYWQPSDFPAVNNQLYVDQDGEQITRDIEMAFTTNSIAAQRIARIHLEHTRQGVTIEALASLKAINLAVMDTVVVTIDYLGFVDKVFLVLSWTLDLEAGGVRLKLKEDAPEVYAWNSGLPLTYDPAPNTTLPDPFSVSAPLSLRVRSETIETDSGDLTYKMYVIWDESTDGFVYGGGRYEMQYKRSADDEWRPSFYIPGDRTIAEIPQVQRMIEYDVRLRAVNSRGVQSSWSVLSGFSFDAPGAGVDTELDYGLFSASVVVSLDYGLFSDAPTTFIGYGSFTT